MSEHMTEWLSAYMDGELHGSRLQRVEAHLAVCRDCQAELDALRALSALLHEAPAVQPVSPDRFVSRVNLRLPHQRTGVSKSRALEVGWWMIPIGLMAISVFASTGFLVRDLVSAAGGLGLLGSAPVWIVPDPAAGANWSAILAQTGLLSGPNLQWAERTESITRTLFFEVFLQVSIALVYLSWITIWWARHTRHGQGQPVNTEAARGRS
jgi:hypothetical protein